MVDNYNNKLNDSTAFNYMGYLLAGGYLLGGILWGVSLLIGVPVYMALQTNHPIPFLITYYLLFGVVIYICVKAGIWVMNLDD